MPRAAPGSFTITPPSSAAPWCSSWPTACVSACASMSTRRTPSPRWRFSSRHGSVIDVAMAWALRARANAHWFLQRPHDGGQVVRRGGLVVRKSRRPRGAGADAQLVDPVVDAARRVRAGTSMPPSGRAIIFTALGDDHRLARLDLNVANIFHRQDRLAEALECYERAYERLVRRSRMWKASARFCTTWPSCSPCSTTSSAQCRPTNGRASTARARACRCSSRRRTTTSPTCTTFAATTVVRSICCGRCAWPAANSRRPVSRCALNSRRIGNLRRTQPQQRGGRDGAGSRD